MSKYPTCFGVRRTPESIEKNLCAACNFEDYCGYVLAAGRVVAEKEKKIMRLQTQVAELKTRLRLRYK